MDGYVQRADASGMFKASGRDNDGRFDFFVLDIGYATGPPLHVHALQEDTFYVLDGVVTVQLGDDIVELVAGDFGTAPPGVAHTFTNARAEQAACRVVNLMTPGIGFDRYIERVNAAKDDAEGMRVLADEFGVTMVGPPLAVRLGLAAR